ncbi:c-type cytochrome domain-containing protein [Isosphaeraceae bacterium EP7]
MFALPLIGLIALAQAPTDAPSFRKDVAPILVARCLGCHNDKKAGGKLNMATFALLKKGGEAGESIVAGDPESSGLIESIQADAEPRMPLKEDALGEHEIETLERWVKAGAKFDGASEETTTLSSLVDPLAGAPKVALKAKVADAVTALAHSPDGKTLAAGVGREVLLHGSDGKPFATLAGHPGSITSLLFTSDGTRLIAAGGRPGQFGSVVVWDVASKAKIHDLRGHADEILGADLAPDGKTLATAGYDRLVMIWDLERGSVVRTLKEHTDAVHGVGFSPDGSRLASASADRTIKVWEVATGVKLATLSDAVAEQYAVVFGPKGETIAGAGVDRSIRVWDAKGKGMPLLRSVFAHDAAVTRLVVSRDGLTLFSASEDRSIKTWELATLSPRIRLGSQSDWPLSMAISADGKVLAVGRYDGSLDRVDAATGKVEATLRSVGGAPIAATKPELSRNASLNPPAPRGGVRGTKVRVTLTGNGVGRATSLIFAEPGLGGLIVPEEKPAPDRLTVDLDLASDARVGVHQIGVQTPLGIPGFRPFAVSAAPEVPEKDEPPAAKLPATLVGTIDKPGDVDAFTIQGEAGKVIVFETVARSIGSPLDATLRLVDDRGHTLTEVDSSGGDAVLSYTPTKGEVLRLEVGDATLAGGGDRIYRINAGAIPTLVEAFPLGVAPGTTLTVQRRGSNLDSEVATVQAPAEAAPGTMLGVPSGSAIPLAGRGRLVVVAEGTQVEEAEPNDSPAAASAVGTPGGASGRIGRAGDVDHFRFRARKGERLIVEVYAGRLGTPLDPVLEILDAAGKPVPRAVVRPVAETAVAFRDHTSSNPRIRLTQWTELAQDDLLLVGRDLMRIEALPKGPDDDALLRNAQGLRLGFLETTPEQHPMAQPVYKVELHPPGTSFPPGGTPAMTLAYRNDDGGPGFGGDSRLTFDAPADGEYIARVEDVRGEGGQPYAYHLVVRRPRPDFRVNLSLEDINVPRGGTALLTASLDRLDGYDGAVDVTLEGLPSGIRASSARIEEGASSAELLVMADADAPAYSPPTWRAVASGPNPDGGTGEAIRHEIDPGGPARGRITVTGAPNLAIAARPEGVTIRPGEQAMLTLAVARGPAYAGRVPIDVRNLPHGVRVMNIGLNGVLVTETQVERSITLYAEPWVKATERPFYAVGRAESAGTEHSSPPITLTVLPPGHKAP